MLPYIYISRPKGNSVVYLAHDLVFGDGEIAPVTHEPLRQAEPDRRRQPLAHLA